MGLTEQLDDLTRLTGEQLVGLDALAAMPPEDQKAFADRVASAWQANLDHLQAALAAQNAARAGFKRACDDYGSAVAPFRVRLMTRQLTVDEAEIEATAAGACAAAYAAKVTGTGHIEQAQRRFKRGVTAEQLGAL